MPDIAGPRLTPPEDLARIHVQRHDGIRSRRRFREAVACPEIQRPPLLIRQSVSSTLPRPTGRCNPRPAEFFLITFGSSGIVYVFQICFPWRRRAPQPLPGTCSRYGSRCATRLPRVRLPERTAGPGRAWVTGDSSQRLRVRVHLPQQLAVRGIERISVAMDIAEESRDSPSRPFSWPPTVTPLRTTAAEWNDQ